MNNTYSCIIPIYNEYPRIIDVLKNISKVKIISEIIAVDDGSTDESYEQIRNLFPKIILLRHDYNKGKAQAVITGLRHALFDDIILIDGDLINLTSFDIEKSINIYEHNNIDCLLLCAKPVNIVDYLTRIVFRLPHLATGNRIVKKTDLITFINTTTINRYQLEFAFNEFLSQNKKTIAYVDISAKNVWKIKKHGLLQGIIEDAQMWHQVLSSLPFYQILKQVGSFGRIKLK